MGEVFNLFAKITLDTSEYDSGLKTAQSKLSSFGNGIKNGLATIGKIGAVAFGAAEAAIGAFVKSSIDAGSRFDSSMSQVAATMGKTTDEIKNLRDFAMEMGQKSVFSATQAADALNYMALAGYDSEKSMQMLPNVLNLAAAGAMDLASASDMVTDAQSALGLSMDETTDLVDKMAMASSKSNTSVSQLGSAILTIGGTAKNLSGGTTELAQALGLLADNGIKGAEGGTALRNILQRLSPKSKEAAEAMAELGFNAYDANGKLRPLKDIFLELNKSMEGMTDQKKNEILSSMFNAYDLKSVNALLATNAKRWDELSNAIDNAEDAAQRMADTQLDNLEGDVIRFKSALEIAQITVSDSLTPSLREFVQFGVNGLKNISDAFKEDGLSGAMDAFSKVLSDGLAMIIEKLPEAIDAGVQLLGAVAKGILDNLPALGDAAIQVVQILGTKLIENVPALLDKGKELGNNIIKFITEGFSENHSDILTGVQTVITTIAEQFFSFRDEILRTGLDIIQWLSEGIFDNTSTVIDAIVNIIESIFTYMTQSLPEIYDKGLQTIGMFADGLMANVPYLINKAAELLNMLVDFIVQNGPKFVESAANLIMKMQEGFTNETPNIINNMGNILINLLDKILDNLPQFLERGVQIVYNMATGVLKNLPEILAAMVTLLGKVLFTIWEHLPQFAGSAVRIIGTMATSIISAGPQLLESFIGVMNGLHDWVWSQDWASIGVHIMQGLIDGVTSMIGALMDVVSDIVDSISSAFEDALEIHSPSKVFWRYGKMLDMGLAEGITDNVGSAESAMGNLSNSLKIGSDMGMDTGMATQPQNTANVGGSFVFNQTINAPQELDPSEIARQSRNAMRATVLQLRMT